MKKLFLLVQLLILSFASFAQEQNSGIEMADTLNSNGKIYIVVAVLLIIFIGIIAFLVRMDRKVSKLEEQLRDRA